MKLDIQKWNPWNWFKHEEKDEASNIPVQRQVQDTGNNNFQLKLASDPIWNIHREIDRIFEDVFSNFGVSRLPRLLEQKASSGGISNILLKPNVDIKETKKDYQITIEIPGVEENDIKLELADNILTISGEKKYEKEEKDEHYHSVERSYGSFRRVLSLPEDVNTDNIEAKFKNGVLTISVPRKEIAKSEGENIKQIEIKKVA